MNGIRKLIFAVLFGAGVAGMIYAISQTVGYRPFLRLQNTLDDRHFSSRGETPLPEDTIAVIDIDDASIAALGNFRDWPRRHFGTVINRVNADGARLVFLDVILLDGGPRRDNETLADAVGDGGNVILGYYFDIDRENGRRRPRDPVYNDRFGPRWFYAKRTERVEFIRAGAANLSYPTLARSATAMGFTNYIPDPDGVLRHIPLYIEYNGSVLPSAALQLWMRMNGLRNARAEITSRGMIIGGTFIPSDKHGFLRLNFHGAGRRHPTVSFADVLNGRIPPRMFQGKVVMIGSSASRLADLKRVPGHDALPGVEIHAAALSTMLEKNFLSVVSGNTVFILTLLCGVCVSILFAFSSPLTAGIPAALATPLVLYLYSTYCFVFHAELINVTVPSAAALFIGAVLTLHSLIEWIERRKNCHAAANE